MARKPRGDKPAPVFFVPPARATRDKKTSSGVSGGTKKTKAATGAPVFFEHAHKLPSLNTWSGWEEDMPPEYLLCPSCLAPHDGKHLAKCPRPNMKRIGWHCPACDTKPRERHAVWCPRNRFQDNPYTAPAYSDSIFLARVGFEKQIIVGHGHPTPLIDSEGKSSKTRIRIYLADQRGDYTSEPWRRPTLHKEERALLKRAGGKIVEQLPDDDLPF